MEIDKMEAGPVVDRLVAERVIKCRVIKCRGHKFGTYKLRVPGSFDRVDYVTAEGAWAACPNYSTDVAADYEVLQVARNWLTKDFRSFSAALLDIWGKRAPDYGWPSTFGTLYEPGDYSRAALKAVEVNNE